MFGFKLVHKRELSLYAATIDDLRKEKEALQLAIERERRRADAAVNALLIKTAKVALTPNIPVSEDQEEAMRQSMFNLFDDQYPESSVLERVQHDSTKPNTP